MISHVRDDDTMLTKNLRRLDPEAMARLLEVQEGEEELWRPEDLAELFHHQLHVALYRELTREPDLLYEREESETTDPAIDPPLYGADRVDPGLTFGAVLHDTSPDIALLKAIKRYAKRQWRSVDAQLPKEVSISLYFLSIASGIARRRQRISGLDPQRLRKGFESVLHTSWVDDESRQVLEEALVALEAPGVR